MSSLFIDHRREKLLNAIVYFVQNTKFVGTVKLFKLLYFFDFEHYRQAGRSVTGLDYYAMQNGPVPCALLDEIKAGFSKNNKIVAVEEKPHGGREFRALKDFKSSYFTPRELEIMETLVKLFVNEKANKMISYSHHPDLPWKKVFRNGAGRRELIPYQLILQSRPIVKSKPTIGKAELRMLDEAFADFK